MELETTQMIARTDGGVGWMVFNNPERRNAMSLEMRRAIPEILGAFSADPEVRVVVMTGAGDKAFVSGADISQFDKHRSDPAAIAAYDEQGRKVEAAFAALDKPLIAMIRGFCMGGGLLTALRADIRIAADDAQFGIPAARLGLGYAYGGVRALMDFVGPAVAAEILFTGGRFPAADALRWGLVNRVVAAAELETTVTRLAATIAENAPLTVKAIKATIGEARRDESRRDMARIEQLVTACFASEDYAEGRRAFMEKRRPAFTGR
jgi:enoyl-CoA hydratase/carnithine racemase